MRRVAALGAGFAVKVALSASVSFAADLAPAAKPVQASAAKPSRQSRCPQHGAAGRPGRFRRCRRKAPTGFILSVTGHKFTTRADIEKYLAWRAAEQTEAQKATWFTFTEARAKTDTVPVPKRDPQACITASAWKTGARSGATR